MKLKTHSEASQKDEIRTESFLHIHISITKKPRSLLLRVIMQASSYVKVKPRVYTLVAFTCSAVVFNSMCLVVLDFSRYIPIALFQPWNGLLPYLFLHFELSILNSFTWLLPTVVSFWVTYLLSGMFENLQKEISPGGGGGGRDGRDGDARRKF